MVPDGFVRVAVRSESQVWLMLRLTDKCAIPPTPETEIVEAVGAGGLESEKSAIGIGNVFVAL